MVSIFDTNTCASLVNANMTGTPSGGQCRVTWPAKSVDGPPVPFTTCGNVTGGNLSDDGSGSIDVTPTCSGLFFVMISSAGGGPSTPPAAPRAAVPKGRTLGIN
jgi:hypothetical protein